MRQIGSAIALAAAIIGIAQLAAIGILPGWVGRYAPVTLLALFPGAWLGSGRACSRRTRNTA